VKYSLVPILLLLFLNGCASYPRYRSGKASTSDPEEPLSRQDRQVKDGKYPARPKSSANLLELGGIIQSYLGTPYKGNSRMQEGLDCSEFTVEVFKKYNRTNLPRTAELQYKTGYKVDYNHLSFGDLVFFRTDKNHVSHVGIYVGFDEFIHSSTSTGVIISSIKDKYWKKRFVGGRRILP
jgi:cell wall-associated NlpC family hydrolase